MKMFKATMTTAALALTLAACEEAPPPPPPVAAPPPAAQAAAPVETAPTAVEAAAVAPYVYSYNPVGKRDPFRSPLEELGPVAQANPVTTCMEPLCAFDLDQLKLVAVVTGDANPLAMVEDPLGRGHIVRRNTRVGRQGGKVTQILRDSLTVTEVFSGNGEIIKNPVTLQLKPDDQQDPSYNLMTGKNYGE
ncbi:pilus assembly protein PilP [Myxococcus sp. CA051A]|nr:MULTISPECIES: pilus assembly protein PilP [Myxococcus]NTX12696.1 pilus assembly protein PilP [Myxococcus sp. CA056]NTX33715.1 pilus assembly protein PilP [Myxococcus sp. CA033]NTX54022.1 pilus assembly protein PilP [Myxococcus sp. CA039A]NTX59178.1 pilus assembly protein PilP [Myxococcus sp. CA051A]